MFGQKYNLSNLFVVKSIFFITTFFCCMLILTVHAEEIPADFDHDDTNFLLSGAHVKVACNICHVRDVYQGIPVTCEECHSTSSLIAKSKKTNEHFESEDSCDNCHTVETWLGARIDHDSVIGTCIDCHNNIVTDGRTSDHIQSADDCQECHTTRRWKQSGFEHTVITGNCFSCHNGSTAKGKHKKHRLSNNQCGDCHHVKNWKPKTFDHKGIKKGCLNCHQDILPALPHPQNNKCEKCHSLKKKWRQVRFEHEESNKVCILCHKDSKPVNHFIILTDEKNRCDDCHRATTSWISNLRFTHEAGNFQEHRTNTVCVVCHISNSSTIIWRFNGSKPFCGGCHASNFTPASHVKAPGINYTIIDLADCTSSCHSYTDNTFAVRDNSRNKNGNYHSALRGRGITAP